MPILTIIWDNALLGTYRREVTESDAEFIRDVLEYPPEQADAITAAKAEADRPREGIEQYQAEDR